MVVLSYDGTCITFIDTSPRLKKRYVQNEHRKAKSRSSEPECLIITPVAVCVCVCVIYESEAANRHHIINDLLPGTSSPC